MQKKQMKVGKKEKQNERRNEVTKKGLTKTNNKIKKASLNK